MKRKEEFVVENELAWKDVIPMLVDASMGRKIWLLEGDLGSGKTTLARYLINYLGSHDDVSSPTFSLVNEYEWKIGGLTTKAFHLDLYRLESAEEAIDIGIEELLDSDDYVLIEWPDVAEVLLPADCFRLKLTHEDGHRKVLVL